MQIQLKPGSRLRSAVDATEVVVVRAPGIEVELTCGGQPMIELSDPVISSEPDPAWVAGTLLGKRYASEQAGLEVLCTRSGIGSLGLGGAPLEAAQSKPLPASD